MKKALILPLAMAVLATGFFLFNRQKPAPISSFEECAAAGNPVMESYPRRCIANGKSFTENVELSSSPTHIHAVFSIFTEGTKRVFTDAKYHERSEKVHLHASNPETIHIHSPGITWQEFFDSLPMKLTQDCLTTGTGQKFCTNANLALKFYLNGNGERSQNLLSQEIRDRDLLLVSFGGEKADVRSQLSGLTKPAEITLDPNE